MTFGSFLLGFFMMVIGFLAVARTNWFVEDMGDLSTVFGNGKTWLSWKTLGLILLIFGFMLAFGLFQLFFEATIGGFFNLGGI